MCCTRWNEEIDNNSSTTLQNRPEVFRQKVDGLVQMPIQKIQLPRLHTRFQSLFYDIIICAIFISVNTIPKFLCHEFILIDHGYDQRMSKVDLHLPGLKNKGFVFLINRSGTEYAAQKVKFLTSTVANSPSLPP